MEYNSRTEDCNLRLGSKEMRARFQSVSLSLTRSSGGTKVRKLRILGEEVGALGRSVLHYGPAVAGAGGAATYGGLPRIS